MTRAKLRYNFPHVDTVKPRPGERIREARKSLGLSQKTLASRLGTTRRRVIAWEGGQNVPSALYLQRIATATGRSIEFLMGEVTLDPVEDEEAARMPLTRDEYAMYGALTARIVAAQHAKAGAGQ